jgi:hypothetical protein
MATPTKPPRAWNMKDLLVAAKMLDKAFDRIIELQGRG